MAGGGAMFKVFRQQIPDFGCRGKRSGSHIFYPSVHDISFRPFFRPAIRDWVEAWVRCTIRIRCAVSSFF